ncbi:MAG: bifunctional phosphoribosylaminoimidazolecarboxamide formyltransferase/IMP cyclohydrolase [Candidatus Hadarchaeota archaeon]
MKVNKALLSVSNKVGIVEFAKGLQALGVEITSTGGTAKALRESGVDVKDVSEITGFPEMLDGRVKTLHPKVHGGILAVRGNARHIKELEEQNIQPIDLIAVNLYPFEETVRIGGGLENAIENIDIGGPAMLRSAAKNYRDVAVVVDPGDYGKVLSEMKANDRTISDGTREGLAAKAFSHTARYDTIISNYLRGKFNLEDFPDVLNLSYKKISDLRYGENPHQKAAFYGGAAENAGVSAARKLWGKELSYNNILDLTAALEVVNEFEEPACAIVKHANPAGVTVAESGLEAYRLTYQTDPLSAFGGVIAINREVDRETAQEMSKIFLEAVIAPKFSGEALGILKKKKNIRLLELKMPHGRGGEKDLKSVAGDLLLQEKNVRVMDARELKTVTKRPPTEQELESLLFAFKVAKYCASNAIVFAKGMRTVSLGYGQPSRIGAAQVGLMKGGKEIMGSVMASDGFFPFRDTVEVSAEAGVTAIIQPGGSVSDPDVIKAADEHGMAMMFTGVRCFRH